jgi:prepilin-type N-terminal cleavage/methylation domain-containing protein
MHGYSAQWVARPVKRNSLHRKLSAFTLLELLVAVFVIAVLMSIMLPALRRSMRQAAKTVCMHNLKTISQVLQMYRVDNQGWLPVSFASAAGDGEKDPWYDLLVPQYLPDVTPLICPDDPYRGVLLRAAQLPVHPDWANATSYGMSAFILSGPKAHLANIERNPPKKPMDTLLVADIGPDTGQATSGGSSGQPLLDRNASQMEWDDDFDFGGLGGGGPWVTLRHINSINGLTMGGAVRALRTVEVVREPVSDFYDRCAAGDCAFCLVLEEPHYTFYRSATYWWTGPIPSP